jgi:hypothetical protein
VQQVCAESHAVWNMDDCMMTVVIQIDSSRALTVLSMSGMTLLNSILLTHFVTNIPFALSLNSHFQKESKCHGCLIAQFGF